MPFVKDELGKISWALLSRSLFIKSEGKMQEPLNFGFRNMDGKAKSRPSGENRSPEIKKASK
jgi:hypothetical protein